MKAGRLQESVAFDAPVIAPDGSGGVESGWEEQHACRAEFVYLRGSEAVAAARLTGRSFFKVKIRQSDAARQITTDWRMRDVRRGTEYQLREVDAVSDRSTIYLVVESGVAV